MLINICVGYFYENCTQKRQNLRYNQHRCIKTARQLLHTGDIKLIS